jgi:hypothetical protein
MPRRRCKMKKMLLFIVMLLVIGCLPEPVASPTPTQEQFPKPVASPTPTQEQFPIWPAPVVREKLRECQRLLKEKKAQGYDVSEALELYNQAQEALDVRDEARALALLEKAIECLKMEPLKPTPTPPPSLSYKASDCLKVRRGPEEGKVEIYVEGNDVVMEHNGVVYNCCAEVVVELVDSRPLLKLIEKETYPDRPPCRCQCPRDITAKVEDLPPGTYNVEVWNEGLTHLFGRAEVTIGRALEGHEIEITLVRKSGWTGWENTFTIHDDGTLVEVNIEGFTGKRTQREGRISREEVEEFVHFILARGFFEMEDRYDCGDDCPTDYPVISITVRIGERTKTIVLLAPREMPQGLREIIERVEEYKSALNG